MRLIKFIKAHGLGNDFIIIDNFNYKIDLSNINVRAICDRKIGIGCDQLILIDNSTIADCKMTIFNADGSKAEACGNASRCVALIQMNSKSVNEVKIEINNNVFEAHREGSNITVNMGKADFNWKNVPLSKPLEDIEADYFLPLLDPIFVNVGNPHVIFFVDDLEQFDLHKIGPKIEHDPLFPKRVNLTLAKIIDQHNIQVKVWERGAGATLACGTAACATAAAAFHKKLISQKVNILFKDRSLVINLLKDNIIEMTGEAKIVFSGEYYLT